MRFDADEAPQIAGWSTIRAGFTLALNAKTHTIVNAGGDLDVFLHTLLDIALTPAVDTRFGDNRTGAAALRAGRLNAHEARRLNHLTVTVAGPAFLLWRTRLAPCRSAGVTFLGTCES